MIGQPSVNDLASVFRGNPGALQTRVNQDMQGQPPGTLPKDLRDLLALQIVTNEQDAVKRNAAMQQLQQMQPQAPQGEPPTVAQSLQEQAKQKIQAQMVQQMRQQQGLQGLMQQLPPGAVPENTPQPQDQPEPQGIDVLPSNVGENYAGGGIIAFSGKDDDQEVPEAKPDRKVYPGMLPMEGGTVLPERSGMEGMTIGDIVDLLRDKARRYFSPEREAENAAAMYAGNQPKPAPGGRPTMANDPRLLTAPQGQALAAADMAESRVGRPVERAPAPAPAPVKRGLPAAVTPPAAPAAPAMSDREKFLAAAYATSPEDAAAKARQEYESQVGQRTTADLAALADELAARRQAIRGRADPLMDWLAGVAMGPRGETWMQSGQRGTQYAEAQRAAREAQDMELLQKLMETKGKIADIEQGYKEKKYTAGMGAYKDTYDRAYNAAKEQGLDDRNAKDIAARAVDAEKDRQNRVAVARIQEQARTAGMDSKEVQMAEAAFARDPEAAAIRKKLEGFTPESKRPALIARLREIQASKYAQFGIKLEGAPSAPSPGGPAPSGWGKAQVVK